MERLKKILKSATVVDRSYFAKPTYLGNLRSDGYKLDDDKLGSVPLKLAKLIDLLKNGVVKKDVYNAMIKNIEEKIPDIANLATNATLNAKINEFKN